jgi:hypothetical protein
MTTQNAKILTFALSLCIFIFTFYFLQGFGWLSVYWAISLSRRESRFIGTSFTIQILNNAKARNTNDQNKRLPRSRLPSLGSPAGVIRRAGGQVARNDTPTLLSQGWPSQPPCHCESRFIGTKQSRWGDEIGSQYPG